MIGAHIVDAFATIDTGRGQTLVQIQLAILALEACRAMADVGAVVIEAYAIVQAWIRIALIDVDFAISALVAAEEIDCFRDKSEEHCGIVNNCGIRGRHESQNLKILKM